MPDEKEIMFVVTYSLSKLEVESYAKLLRTPDMFYLLRSGRIQTSRGRQRGNGLSYAVIYEGLKS